MITIMTIHRMIIVVKMVTTMIMIVVMITAMEIAVSFKPYNYFRKKKNITSKYISYYNRWFPIFKVVKNIQ